MKSKNLLLLKNLLLSTSRINVFRYTTDKKKKHKIIASVIGLIILYAMLIGYSFSICVGYGKMGMIDAAPVLCALSISMLSFVFTFFKTNGYLFNFREYDMLMALPFEPKTVAGCKFLYMYIESLPFYLCISVSFLAGFGYYKNPVFPVYPLWILLSLFLPVIPMLAASFFGFLIAKISAGFKKSNLIQTILTFAFALFCFSIRFIVEDVFRNDKVEEVMNQIHEMTDQAASYYPPAAWFSNGVISCRIPDILLLIVVSSILFTVIFLIIGKSYRNINSAMKSHAASKNFKMATQKKRSVRMAIVFKEFKRLTGSTSYTVNGAMGELLALIFGFVTLIMGFDNIVKTVVNGAPIDPAILQPAIPFIVYFFIGMMSTTACSPSLEGKNYWILQSLPIEMTTVYQGKMLFNMFLTVPFMCFTTLCICISAKVPIAETVLYLILGVVLCGFSTAWGCVCGIKHMRLDWENEIEVIKQGAAVAIYMFPNMFIVMGLVVLMVFLGIKIDHRVLALIMIAVASALCGLCYLRVMALAKKER